MDRLEKLEDKIGEIRIDQSAIKENLTIMGKTLNALADMRAETLHMMKQQEDNKKEHEDLFARILKVENGRAICDEKHLTAKISVSKLEQNQKWVVTLILASLSGYVLKKLLMG